MERKTAVCMFEFDMYICLDDVCALERFVCWHQKEKMDEEELGCFMLALGGATLGKDEPPSLPPWRSQ
ncbi:hypothetical protein VNO77_22550 [Canavalia gladiata]|uniref:Uncharacterized protein n=1 Tax=Canavalia gladiata TaxID=3824 RepID=A0AAN9QB41_CANGL